MYSSFVFNFLLCKSKYCDCGITKIYRTQLPLKSVSVCVNKLKHVWEYLFLHKATIRSITERPVQSNIRRQAVVSLICSRRQQIKTSITGAKIWASLHRDCHVVQSLWYIFYINYVFSTNTIRTATHSSLDDIVGFTLMWKTVLFGVFSGCQIRYLKWTVQWEQ